MKYTSVGRQEKQAPEQARELCQKSASSGPPFTHAQVTCHSLSLTPYPFLVNRVLQSG